MKTSPQPLGRPPSSLHASTVLLRIAGVVMRLNAQTDGPPIIVSGAATAFVVDRGSPDIDIDVRWGDVSAPCGRLVFDSGGVWTLHEDGDRLSYSFTSPTLGGTYRCAVFDRDFRRGVVTLDRTRLANRAATYALEYPLDELVVINRLTFTDGIEIHGCGVADTDGRGYLFAGQSGAGKSTIARLWSRAGATILSDDRVILRTDEAGIMMHGTPWHGDAEYAEPRSVRLSRILFLRQAPRHGMAPVPAAHAGALLFSCAFPVFHSAEALERTLASIQRMVGGVSVGAIEFAPTADVVSFVRRTVL